MPKASPILTNFNAGELSPLMEGRTDVAKYANGCSKLENFVSLVQGPAQRRPGTHFVTEVKNSGLRTWLAPFRFNRKQSYVLEFGNLYTRFYTDRGVLLNAGIPYEIASPYGTGALTDQDGRFTLSTAQSNDAMFFAHGGFFPEILERLAHTNWAFRPFGLPVAGTFRGSQYSFQTPMGPFNIDISKKIRASAPTGNITLTALVNTFQPWMVSSVILLESGIGSLVKAWEPAKAVIIGDLRRVDSRVYRCTVAGNTGTIRPTHTEGTKPDGDIGATWDFVHPGYGVVHITGYTSATVVTGTVLMELPSDVVGAGQETYRWQVSAWNSNDGYPTAVAFSRERLWWFRGLTFWASVSGDFFNYAERDNGEVLPDSAITGTIASDTADAIRWARSIEAGLLVGTDGGEFLISEITTSEPLGPANVQAKRQSSNGCATIQPIGVQEATLYVQSGGRVLREAAYSIEDNQIKSRDLTVLSEHITVGGLQWLAFQPVPRSTLWSGRADGTLLSFTYNREQDVYGWHPHPIGGDGIAESGVSIPSPDGTEDDLWVIVKRTIDATTKRYVEYLDRGFRRGDAITEAWYVDCGLAGGPVFGGAFGVYIPGLAHLEGKTVDVLLDGSPTAQGVVTAGAVLVPSPPGIGLVRFEKAIVGLPCPCVLGTMRVEAGAADGSAQGKTKRAHRVGFRFVDTVGGRAGPVNDPAYMDDIEFGDNQVAMNQPVQPFTGDKMIDWPGTYETDGRVFYRNDQPLPATIAAIMPQLVTQDR